MATKKITVTIDEDDLAEIRKLVADGTVASVSGFVQHAIKISLDDVRGWGAEIAMALEATGGPLTDEERAWADSLLGYDKPRERART